MKIDNKAIIQIGVHKINHQIDDMSHYSNSEPARKLQVDEISAALIGQMVKEI